MEKRKRGRIQGLPLFWVPPISSGTGKATDLKFGQYIQRVHPNKIPLKILEKRECGRIQGLHIFCALLSQERVSQGLPKIFRAPIHTAHRAVIFTIAQISCLQTVMSLVSYAPFPSGQWRQTYVSGGEQLPSLSRLSPPFPFSFFLPVPLIFLWPLPLKSRYRAYRVWGSAPHCNCKLYTLAGLRGRRQVAEQFLWCILR